MAERQYDNTNRGALFPNDRKTTDRHPDYNGKLNIDGVEYWISGWVKDYSRGEMISLSLGDRVEQRSGGSSSRQATSGPRTVGKPNGGTSAPAGEASRRAEPASAPGNGFEDMDDDIPF